MRIENTDHRDGIGIDRDLLTHDARVSAQLSLPEPVAENGDLLRVRPVFIARERAANREVRAEEVKKAGAHAAADDLLRLRDPCEIDWWTDQIRGHIANAGGVFAPRVDPWRRHEPRLRSI